MIIRDPLPRRTFLQSMGAVVALPMLDAMIPTRRLFREPTADPTRLICIEMVHGAAGCNQFGATQNYWAPAGTGSDFDLSPTALTSLDRYRKYLTIISNTDVKMAEAYQPEEIGGDHFRSSAVFLTQAHPTQTESSDIYVGASLDQIYAKRFGQTPRSRRCSSASSRSIARAAVRTAIPASTRTRSAGRRRPNRCR